jgi:glucan phosphoethanolaminetransferase (alkaline phosphatase superfamily)
MDTNMNIEKRPSKIWWLWVPLAWLFLQFGLEIAFDHSTLVTLHTEGGPHETVQFLLLVLSFLVALRILATFPLRTHPWLAAWVGLMAVCCFYVAGEEVSWGQHIIGWTTPEFWSGINDQNETNLHNTSSWLDQKPRLLLEIGVIVSGLILPLLRKYRPALVPARFAAIYPPSYLWVTAALFVFCKVADAIAESMGFNLFERVSEIIELYLYWFVFLYALYLARTLPKRA